jgi:hypothetical protein
MVNVTSDAIELLDELRADAVEQTGQPSEGEPALRLVAEGGEFGLTIDTPSRGDQVIEREGHPVLLVNDKVTDEVGDVTIDVEVDDEGKHLVIE